jgi:hypothetical protein
MTSARFVEHVHCSRCGKRVSGVDPELGLVVRAFVECPECLDGDQPRAAYFRELAEWHQRMAAIERDEALAQFHDLAAEMLRHAR